MLSKTWIVLNYWIETNELLFSRFVIVRQAAKVTKHNRREKDS